MSVGENVRAQLDRIQGISLIVGVAGLIGCAGSGVLWPSTLLPAYLVGFLFWTGIGLGCIAILLLHNLTGGNWGRLIRRPLEAGALTVIPMAVLFIPIALGLKALYPWADPAIAESEAVIRHKAAYLNTTAFVLRSAFGFAVWIVLALVLNKAASIRDQRGEAPKWLPTLSGPGLALTFFTASFAAIDWGMTLEPEWYSSIYGVMVLVGWGLLTFATMIVITSLLARSEPVASVATPGRLQDLGNLMLAFVMLWAYMAFSQFLIIWSGNLVEEIPWYLRRLRGGWEFVALALVLFHFFVPFFALLFRDLKRNSQVIIWVALAVIVMHLVDLTWLVVPARSEVLGSDPRMPWGTILLVPVATAGIGGVSITSFLWLLKRRPLVLIGDLNHRGSAEHD
jgi:hypothetical protein